MSELLIRANRKPHPWHNNPALVQLLGLSPLLAVSTSAVHGIALGVGTVAVLLCASITLSICQKLINKPWRFVIYIFVLAVFTTIFDIIMRRYFFALHKELGIYVPLICCNFALLIHLDSQPGDIETPQHFGFARHWQALYAAILAGIGYLVVLVAFAAVRELLIHAQVFNDWTLLIPNAISSDRTRIEPAGDIAHFARLAPSGFFLLGLVLALKNLLQPPRSEPDKFTLESAKRARVTGTIQTP